MAADKKHGGYKLENDPGQSVLPALLNDNRERAKLYSPSKEVSDEEAIVRNLCVSLTLLLAATVTMADDRPAVLDKLMRKYHELGHFNGVALVMDADKALLRKGHGNADMQWQISNAPGTRFAVGSVTKSFTAAVIAQLVDEGKLDLDKTVSDYLPYYRQDTGEKITLRHLLAHTDGLPNYTAIAEYWQSYEDGVPYSTAGYIEKYCSSDLAFEPGTEYRYGNSGYSILGAIIEETEGARYGEVIRRRVLEPLGMAHTGQLRLDKPVAQLASGYEIAIDGYRNVTPIYKPLFAAGSMYSTVDDLLKYDRSLYGNDVLSGDGKALLLNDREGAIDGTFAFGWSVGEYTLDGLTSPLRFTATNGEVNGFNAIFLRIVDHRQTIILLNNTGETDLFPMAANLLGVMHGLPAQEPEPRVRDEFYRRLQQESLHAALRFYREQREENYDDYIYFRWPLRILATQLMADGRYDDAIEVLKANLETHPGDSRSLESVEVAKRRAGHN